MPKLSRVSFFLFVFFYSYLWLRTIIFNYFYNNFGTEGFVLGLVMLLIVGVLMFFVPKKINKLNWNNLLKKSGIKWLLTIINVLEIVFLTCYVSLYLKDVFINQSNLIILVIFLGIVIIYVSNMKSNEVIDMSTLFYIFGIVLIVISFMIMPKIETEYLFISGSGGRKGLLIMSGFLFLDSIKLSLVDKEKIKYNSSLPFICGILLMLIEYGLLIMMAGDKTFIGLDYVGFLKLSFMPVTKYFGDFNFVYIYLMVVCLVFRSAFNLSVIKENIKVNKTIINLILFSLIVGSSLILLKNMPINGLYKCVILIVYLMVFVFIWMIWECNYVRKSKR